MRKRETVVREYPITVEIKGKTYAGKRIVSGTRLLHQTVYYGQYCENDSQTYESENHMMVFSAKVILAEIIGKHNL